MNRVGASSGSDPPPNAETLKRAAKVRIDVLAGSIQGLGFGLVAGFGGWPLYRRTMLRGKTQFLHSKYHIFTTLALGALGSFIGSLAACRNSLEVQLAGLESEQTRNQRRADEAFLRRRQALQQRKAQDGTMQQEGGMLLDAGSAFPNPFEEPDHGPGLSSSSSSSSSPVPSSSRPSF